MRFDPHRAQRDLRALSDPRPAGSPGERAAAGFVAAQLGAKGLRVVVTDVPAPRPGWFGKVGPDVSVVPLVSASRPSEPPAPRRLVVHAGLDGRGRGGTAAPDPGDLAVLLELARTWPGSCTGRVEPWFVASGGSRLGPVGLRNWLGAHGPAVDPRPTLFFALHGATVGTRLVLTEPVGDSPVAPAATSLWIPHTLRRPGRLALRRVWPVAGEAPGFVVIQSEPDRAGPVPAEGPADRVRRVVQLATEVALRWSKAATE